MSFRRSTCRFMFILSQGKVRTLEGWSEALSNGIHTWVGFNWFYYLIINHVYARVRRVTGL